MRCWTRGLCPPEDSRIPTRINQFEQVLDWLLVAASHGQEAPTLSGIDNLFFPGDQRVWKDPGSFCLLCVTLSLVQSHGLPFHMTGPYWPVRNGFSFLFLSFSCDCDCVMPLCWASAESQVAHLWREPALSGREKIESSILMIKNKFQEASCCTLNLLS